MKQVKQLKQFYGDSHLLAVTPLNVREVLGMRDKGRCFRLQSSKSYKN